MKEDLIYIEHISGAIGKIRNYVKNLDKKGFQQDEMVQDAVIRQLEIIGEASKQVSEKTRKKYQNVPWKDISGMRDKLIHHYFGVDLEAVWLTINQDLEFLDKELKK